MRRTWIAASVVLGIVGGWLAFDLAGPPAARGNATQPPTGKTGGPPSGQSCAQCHNAGVNDGTGLLQFLRDSGSYVPGNTYAIVILLGRTGNTRWGFEVTALKQDGTMAGSFANVTDLTTIQSSGSIDYVSHVIGISDGTFAGTANAAGWGFEWTAPAAGAGTVTFYVAGVAADNDDSDNGDYTFTTTDTWPEGGTTAVETTTWGRIKQIYR